ncbi:hypothetical protein CEXT_126801 [Caerostris extrusa]|uniref:Uncharacterized protein n=1 Tax=Caerostris extrusa TaxID=172846 RepID=A0AAV4YBD7_CAEEX|nr:hypothetical protein CEXT_126801 [Caerostris extrusa]
MMTLFLSKPTCSEEFDLSFNSDSRSSAFSDKSKSKLTHKQDSKIYTFSEATYLSSKDNSNIKNSALSGTSGSSLTENVGEFENNFGSQITNHSLKKDENELVSLNIDDANSEIHAGSEVTCLSFKDTSNAPSVVDSLRFSEDSLSSSTVIHNLSKSETSVHQNKESKNVIQYELETSSSNRELNNEGQKSGILHYSDDASTEIDVTKISHSTDSNGEIAPCNLTFHGALAPVIGEHENSKNALNNNDVVNLSENSYEIFSDAVKKSLL